MIMNPASTSVGSIEDTVLEMNHASTSAGSVEESVQEMRPDSTPIVSIEDKNPIRQEDETKPSTTSNAFPQPNRQNLPCGDLLEMFGDRNNIRIPLYKASLRSDWQATAAILEKYSNQYPYQDLVGYAITDNYDTALHVVASCKSSKAVEKFLVNLVNKMTKEQLELQNKEGNTALCLAAAAGNVKIVITMLKKNKALIGIPGRNGAMPIHVASIYGESEMVKLLYEWSSQMRGDLWNPTIRSLLFLRCLEADIFDVSLKMVSDWPELAKNATALGILARKPEAFKGTKLGFIWRIIRPIFAVIDVKVGATEKPTDAMKLLRIMLPEFFKSGRDTMDMIIRGPPDIRSSGDEKRTYSSGILFVAAEMGNSEFLVELIGQYPDFIWKKDDQYHSIFHIAVMHRHVDIYNLVHEIGSMRDVTLFNDSKGNNILHLVGKCPKSYSLEKDSGIGLLMQREVSWYKEVEALVPPSYRERKNRDGLTPERLFKKDHQEMLLENERWMKDTANQCLIVATLIASIAFAAAFGVPGGYDQNTGFPMFLHNQSFIVFAISDAISLAFSSVTIFIFLSMFTSRYAELDFLESLPKKLMSGLAALFLSITAMLVGFSASIFVIFQDKFIWVPIIISLILFMPIILYARLQFQLLSNVYHSTFGSKHIFRPKKPRMFL